MLGLGVYKGVKAAGQESYIACFLWGRQLFLRDARGHTLRISLNFREAG